jgi:hypothetical protein
MTTSTYNVEPGDGSGPVGAGLKPMAAVTAGSLS